MNIEYSDGVKQSESFELIQRATKRLEEIVGPKDSPHVSGRWDRAGGEGAQGQFTLRLRNPDGEVTEQLDLDELENPHFRSFRMGRTWDGLLALRLQKLLANMNRGDE